MRFIHEKEISPVRFAEHERFFLDCWYGLTHMRSLDSHRAKCMNARTIIRELHEELAIGRLDDPELSGICAEALVVLSSDSVIANCAPRSVKAIAPLLEKPPSLPGSAKKDKIDAENLLRLRELRFAVSDLSAYLETNYLEQVCSILAAKVAAKEVDLIPSLTNSLVSDLVARDWPLESLHSWHRHFLSQSNYGFKENLEFMLKNLQRERQEFDVTLRVNGGMKLQSIHDFGGFKLSSTSGIAASTDIERAFSASGSYVVFAQGTFSGVDFASAAITARSRFESLLDILRFEYERTSLKIDHRIFVKRRDGRTDLVSVSNPVPNPVESLNEQDFHSFFKVLDRALQSPELDSESKNRLRAAFRQYRFGCDSESYADKFLNWWMGLETLANVGGEKIGRTVTRNVSHAMLTGYLHRLLGDLLSTLRALKHPWNERLKATTGVDSIRELNVRGLLKILQDTQLHSLIWATLQNHPFVLYHAKRIADWLCDPQKAAEQIRGHQQRLQWHIDRLYRIRCCIVHGSPVRFRLALFAANLEYYLKQTLIFALEAFQNHPHISDLTSLFQRSVLVWDRHLKSLAESAADKARIADALFADVVINN